MSVDTGGPVMPNDNVISYQVISTEPMITLPNISSVSWPGMTLLDYFAGQVMNAIILGNLSRACIISDKDSYLIAKDAYEMAGRMISEKRKREKE